jgi:predicted ATP-grasp superfamily ATP-dependent carboligase
LGADLFADADLETIGPRKRITDYPQGLAHWLDQTECDGWIYTGGLENYPAQIAAMAARRPLLGCGGEVLKGIRSPRGLAVALEPAGLRFPRTIPLSACGPVPAVEATGNWLIKTCRGSSGCGVQPLVSGTGTRVDPTDRPTGDCYLQQYIDGSPCSALFLARAGQVELLGMTRQLVGERWTGAAQFQYCGSIGPHPRLPAEVSAQIERIGEVLAKTFRLMGLFGVDLILASSQVWTIEVNPRYTAAVEIVERVSGLPLMGRHVRACLRSTDEQPVVGKRVEAARPVRQVGYHGKAILFAQQRVIIRREFTRWALGSTCGEGWPPLADIPRPGTEIGASQPVVTLFATGDSPAEVEGALRQRVAQTQQKLYVGV